MNRNLGAKPPAGAGARESVPRDSVRPLALPKWLDSQAGAAVVVLAFALGLGLPGLGSTGLVKMEGMIADIATEMLRSGDYILPRLYGEIFTYKPPLLYWLAAFFIWVSGGVSEAVLRLPTALSAPLVGLPVAFFVGRLAGPRTGALAGVASFTSALFLQKLQIAEYDSVLAAFVGIAVAAASFALARDERRGTGAVWLVSYFALAAAFLTKGLPALMVFGPGLLVAAAATGRWRTLFRKEHLAGVLLFALLVGGYLGSVHRAAGGSEVFAQPLAEARERGATWSLAELGLTLAKPALVWVFFLPWSLGLFWARPRAGADPSDRLLRAGWGFLLAGTAAFMLVPTHEPRYYLPLAVPFAIVGAIGTVRMARSERALARRLPIGLAGLVGLATLAVGLAPVAVVPSLAARALLVGIGLAALTAPAALAAKSDRRLVVALALVMTALCLWSTETFSFRHRRAAERDLSQAAAVLRRHVPPGNPVWTLGPAGDAGEYASLLYYLERPIRSFRVGEPPPAGSLTLLREMDLPRLDRGHAARLRRIARVETTWWTFVLYREAADESAATTDPHGQS